MVQWSGGLEKSGREGREVSVWFVLMMRWQSRMEGRGRVVEEMARVTEGVVGDKIDAAAAAGGVGGEGRRIDWGQVGNKQVAGFQRVAFVKRVVAPAVRESGGSGVLGGGGGGGAGVCEGWTRCQ